MSYFLPSAEGTGRKKGEKMCIIRSVFQAKAKTSFGRTFLLFGRLHLKYAGEIKGGKQGKRCAPLKNVSLSYLFSLSCTKKYGSSLFSFQFHLFGRQYFKMRGKTRKKVTRGMRAAHIFERKLSTELLFSLPRTKNIACQAKNGALHT